MLTGLGISIAWAANLIYAHVEPHVWYDRQQRWVLFMCFLAYLIAWVPVWLLPFDLVGTEARHAERRRCSELGLSWLAFLWWMVYATNLAAGYLTYDFARSYLDAGGFTVRRRLILALVDIRDWYSVAFLICVAIIFAVAFFSDQVFVWSFWDLLASIIYALANFYAVRTAHAPRTLLSFPHASATASHLSTTRTGRPLHLAPLPRPRRAASPSMVPTRPGDTQTLCVLHCR